MSAGYFNDGSGAIGLDGDVVMRSSYKNDPAVARPYDRASAQLFEVGGDANTLIVHGIVERYNRGDAEWYLYQKLLALAGSGVGELGVGGRRYPGCFFIAGEGLIAAFTLVEYTLAFLQSAQARPGNLQAMGSPPSAPGEYAGRNSNGVWTFGGRQIGDYAEVSLSASRPAVLNKIPRAYGARVKDLPHGREMSLMMSAWTNKTTRPALEEYVHELLTDLGTTPATLTGNGNSFTQCHLLECRMDDRDWKDGKMSLVFENHVAS